MKAVRVADVTESAIEFFYRDPGKPIRYTVFQGNDIQTEENSSIFLSTVDHIEMKHDCIMHDVASITSSGVKALRVNLIFLKDMKFDILEDSCPKQFTK